MREIGVDTGDSNIQFAINPVNGEIEGDPMMAVGDFGKGRSAVFTSDCSPHWAPMEFVSWAHYKTI